MNANEAMSDEPISADDAYRGTGSNEELWPILASHGAVNDPSDVRDSYLATVLINWRNAACKDVADRYHREREHTASAELELTRQREVNRDVARQCIGHMERATNAEHDLAEANTSLEQAHTDNGKLKAFIAELADTPKQWRLVGPDGGWQVFPREAIEGGAPWPGGWRIEARDVSYGKWVTSDVRRPSYCPWCGTSIQLDVEGFVPPHENPNYCDECPGTSRRPSERVANDGQ